MCVNSSWPAGRENGMGGGRGLEKEAFWSVRTEDPRREPVAVVSGEGLVVERQHDALVGPHVEEDLSVPGTGPRSHAMRMEPKGMDAP